MFTYNIAIPASLHHHFRIQVTFPYVVAVSSLIKS